MIRALTLVALTVLSHLPAQANTARVLGYVRDADTQRYLYTEVHEQTLAPDGSVLTGVTTYHDPQGREVARKTLDYRANRTVPLYRLDIPGQRYAEGISGNTGTVQLFKQDQGKETREALSPAAGLVAADAGFNQLMLDQMGKLLAGETFRFTLIAAGNTDQYRFRARKVGATTLQGEPAVRILVEPDSMLRLLVDPIELTYDQKGTRLMAYRGVSNILNPATGSVYKNIQIAYGGKPPADVQVPGGK